MIQWQLTNSCRQSVRRKSLRNVLWFWRYQAGRIRQNDRSAIFKNISPAEAAQNVACFIAKYIAPKGPLIIAAESRGWIKPISSAYHRRRSNPNIIRRNNLPKFDINLVQDKQNRKQILNIHEKEKESDKEPKI